MSTLSNVFSTNNNSNALTTIAASSIINFPKEILELICRYLNSAKDVVQLASTHHKFYFLASNSPLSAPLWNLFLRKDFPHSCKDLKSETESLAFYKYLTNVEHNMKTGKFRLQTLNSHREGVSFIRTLDDKLISGSYDCTIKIWNLNTGQVIQTLNGHEEAITYITILDGKLISCSHDNTIKIWNLETGQLIRTLNGHQGWITCIKIWDGKLISCSQDKTIKIWNLETGQLIQTLNGHQDWITCIKIWDGKLISCSHDNTIKIWNLETGQLIQTPIQTLNGHQDWITCMTILDGLLISGSYDGTIKIWNLETGQEIWTLKGHQGEIRCMRILDGMLISASDDTTIKIWDLETGQEIRTLKGHQGEIRCMRTLGGMLISGSDDTTIKIWDLNTGQEIQTLQGNEYGGGISCIKTLNGKIISGPGGNTIMTWDFNFLSLSSHFQKEQTVIKSKQILKDHWDEDLPLLLVDLGIVTKEEYSQKLKCPPDHLPKIGICSIADLKALGLFKNSFHFDDLKGIAEEAIESSDQSQDLAIIKKRQDSAFDKKESVFSLLKKLYDAARTMAEEAGHGAIFGEATNIWTAFQKKLESIRADLDMECQTRHGILSTFSQESYAKIVTQMNALINEFQKLSHEHQIAILSDYINQHGIFKVWNERYTPRRINSLSSLLEQKDAPQDLFRMGI